MSSAMSDCCNKFAKLVEDGTESNPGPNSNCDQLCVS